MSLTIAVFVYAAAMNLSIATWGPWVSPINAFVLIGLDLALRDWLHVRLKAWQMGAVIGLCGSKPRSRRRWGRSKTALIRSGRNTQKPSASTRHTTPVGQSWTV